MKHLLRKLHIGGGGGGGGGVDHHPQHPHHQRLGDPSPKPTTPLPPPPLQASAASSSSSSSSSSSAASSRGRANEEAEEARGSGSRGETSGLAVAGDGGSFSFEEEYQMQLALAISTSDPDGLEDPDLVQMKAAKRMSLGCSAAVGGASSGGDQSLAEFLALRYWNFSVVNYDEKLMDGFYDVYGVIANPSLQGKLPALVDLQAIPVSENIDYEVVVVNRTIDPMLQQLERRAMTIASEDKAEHGLVASGLVQKIADLVVDVMGGPVEDAEEMQRRWTIKSCELRASRNNIILPLGSLEVGLSRHRALLFKVLADRINLPCKLVKGSYYTGTDGGAVNLIKVDFDSEYIVDLMGAPGTLIPAESSTTHLQNSENYQLSSDIIEESVKELCLALDTVSSQVEKKNELSESSSETNFVPEVVDRQSKERVHSAEENGASSSENSQTERFENEYGNLLSPPGRSQAGSSGTKEVISPAQQMKVNDVSKYVVTAAKNPEFAQKLHAVLLESGAFPPPDLFSSLNPSLIEIEQNEMGSTFASNKEETTDGQLLDSYSASHFHSRPNLHLQSSMHAHNNEGQKLKALCDVGSSSPSVPNDLSVAHHVNDLWAEGFSQLDNTMLSGALCGNQLWASSAPYEANAVQKTNFDNSKSDDMNCYNKNAQIIIYNAEASGNTVKDSVINSLGSSDKDIPSFDGSVNKRVNSVIDDVAECEIAWEDLQIGERIGLGSYGEVYRADLHGTEVAVKKFLDQDLSGDALEQFRCEVKIMLRLRHPNVVLFMGAVTRPPNLSILTEFLPRGSLYRLLHRPNVQLDEKRRLKMALDVVYFSMNYLHTSHPTIVHRDLKSPNLLVDKNWVVKVCDFGLSRLKHHTFLSSKSTAGTPEWMAPEVLRNEPSNEKCDVYSFGIILWELATLRMPWSGLNPMQVVGAVGFQNRRLEIPAEVDPMVAQIIHDCWESDQNKRPSFAQLMSALKQLQRLVVPVS
uniref:non-specific serine/threonine protein kinase n=1 Tax=Ananas comosus var. bracteatus TaxID=296719 RepID=A0A6V7QQ37_ANACO